MRADRMRIVEGERVCPECHKGPLLLMDGYVLCPAEDPHPGGVIIYPDGSHRRPGKSLKVLTTPPEL